MSFAEKSEGYIDWNTPIDAQVRSALVDFFEALTEQYALGGRTYSLRSLLRRHLDAPISVFLRSAGVDANPISRWGTPNDLRVDRTVAALAPLMADDARVRATTDALIGLGYKLNGCRTSKTSRNPLQSCEYCECCDRYTARYQNALEERTYLSRKVLVHPLISAGLGRRPSHRFCDTCSSLEARSKKTYQKGQFGAERGGIRFSRLMMEDRLGHSNNADNFLGAPRFPAGYGSALHRAWPWTKRKMAKIISSGPPTGASSAKARMRHLGERKLHQNEFVIEVIRSLLPSNFPLPSWLLHSTGDFAQVELATILHGSAKRLVLSGYGSRGVRHMWIPDIASTDAMRMAKQAFSDLTAKPPAATQTPPVVAT